CRESFVVSFSVDIGEELKMGLENESTFISAGRRVSEKLFKGVGVIIGRVSLPKVEPEVSLSLVELFHLFRLFFGSLEK
ncbi:14023_t:CDS:2, partial [Funneliformis geosporum]